LTLKRYCRHGLFRDLSLPDAGLAKDATGYERGTIAAAADDVIGLVGATIADISV
jgi:hypothetical protein